MVRIVGTIVVGMVVLGSCASRASIQSERNAAYAGSPKKVFVLSDAGKEGELDYQEFEKAMAYEAQKCAIELMVSTVHPLEMTPKVHRERMVSYQPDAVLTVKITGGLKREHTGQLVAVDYDAMLRDATDETVIWRGRVQLEPGLAPRSSYGGETLATILFKQLATDGVLRRCLSAPRKYPTPVTTGASPQTSAR